MTPLRPESVLEVADPTSSLESAPDDPMHTPCQAAYTQYVTGLGLLCGDPSLIYDHF